MEEPAGADLDAQLMRYDELEEASEVSVAANSTRLWKLLLALLVVTLVLLGASSAMCFTDAVCRGSLPTLHALLSNTLTAPFVVLAVTAAALAHAFTAVGLYYRCVGRARGWSRVQLAAAVALYGSLLVALLVFPFTSWPHNWANLGSIVALGCWMLAVQAALHGALRDRLARERRLLRLALAVFVLYALGSAVYIVLRAVPAAGYAAGLYAKHVGLLVSEVVWGTTTLAYMVLAVLHVRRVNFSVFLADDKHD